MVSPVFTWCLLQRYKKKSKQRYAIFIKKGVVFIILQPLIERHIRIHHRNMGRNGHTELTPVLHPSVSPDAMPTAHRDVNPFHAGFAFGPKILYLCMSKGSARAFPFFSPHSPKGGFLLLWNAIRPKRCCKRAFPRLSSGPNELPSVALLQDERAATGESFHFSCRFKAAHSFRHLAARTFHVVYFHFF